MSSDDILDKITVIIKDTFNEQDLDISRDISAEDIDEWDSLSHIELISNIEGKFQIRFALGELQDLQNVGDMIDLINIKIK